MGGKGMLRFYVNPAAKDLQLVIRTTNNNTTFTTNDAFHHGQTVAKPRTPLPPSLSV
jgi:hypothetical protein